MTVFGASAANNSQTMGPREVSIVAVYDFDASMLIAGGANPDDVVVCDSRGILHSGRTDIEGEKAALAAGTNAVGRTGGIADALRGADVLIGVSGGAIPEDAVAGMAPDPIVFALANPTPEVPPAVAARYAAVVATGRSDYPNQINNVLAFPGVFRGLLDAQSTTITDAMLVAAARALADVVPAEELGPDYIIPSVFHPDVASGVAAAVRDAALAEAAKRLSG